MPLRTLAMLLCLPAVAFAIVSPKHGVTVSDQLKARMAAIRTSYAEGYWAQRMEQRRAMRDALSKSGTEHSAALATDTVFAPILLGRYADVSARFPVSAFQQLLFDGPNASGTVTQYYWDNSYGQLYFTGKAEGWFGAPRSADYYINDGADKHGLNYGGRDFTIDIMVAADDAVDFSQYVKYYDGIGQGHVPQLGIVHTGADAAAGGDNIWSHRWNIRERLLQRKQEGSDPYFDVSRVTNEGWYVTNDQTPGGKAVVIDGDYAIHPELTGSSNVGSELIEIGVFVHEFGHIFKLPDLYDTDNSSEGLGQWCVMASGSYGGDGSHSEYPCNFSAWCKERMGWVTPTVVTTFRKGQRLQPSALYPQLLKVWSLGAPGNEYFLIENRQKIMSDRYLLNSGLLIFHVDNSRTSNRDEDHYWVDLEQADGQRDLNRGRGRGDAGDPFPGSTNNRAFDGRTNPNSISYAGSESYVGVRNIIADGTDMIADLDVGTRAYVTAQQLVLQEGAGANSNGRIEPGETADARLDVENLNPTGAGGLTVRVWSNEPGAETDTLVAVDMGPLEQRSLQFANLVRPSSSFEPREMTLHAAVLMPGDTNRLETSALIGYPALLVADRDSVDDDAASYIRQAAEANGIYTERLRIAGNSVSSAALERRQLVVWMSGKRSTATVPDSSQQELVAYLATGGHLLVTGQNIAEDLEVTAKPFLTDVLHARWSKNIGLTRTLNPLTADPLGAQLAKIQISGPGGASNQTSPDQIIPDSTAHPFLRYQLPGATAVAGLWHHNTATNAKLVFLGFGFEAISDSSSSMTRAEIMNTLLAWYSGVTAVPGGTAAPEVPAVSALAQNYPNPFNPSTILRYTVSAKSIVRLAVYDLLGREVALLVNGQQPQGQYAISFDGSGLASGVYLCRLSVTGEDGTAFESSRRMLLLR